MGGNAITEGKSTLQLHLVRHGEAAWSPSGQHTGQTDLPLTEHGEQEARTLTERLRSVKFSRVFTSPLMRARRTSELAGQSKVAEIEIDAVEWDYGDYEGQLPADICKQQSGWNIFHVKAGAIIPQ